MPDLRNFHGGRCASCHSRFRALIDSHLLNKVEGSNGSLSLRELSQEVQISKTALWEHRVRCLGVPLVQPARIAKRRAQAQEVIHV